MKPNFKQLHNLIHMKELIAKAPAKIIISGEYSVLLGQPAIAMAVNKYTTTRASWHETSSFIFSLLNLKYAKTITKQTLKSLQKRIHSDYIDFLSGKICIKEVLKKPFELIQFTVTNLLEQLNLQLPKGLNIEVNSTIPIGCGMGSSAASVISTLYAIIKLLGLNIDPIKFLLMGKQVENLQHGRSSGLDLHLSAFGGVRKFQNGRADEREIKIDIEDMYLVNTGVPKSSTGECVSHVLNNLTDKTIVEDFGSITNEIDKALQEENIDSFKFGIKENHKLLNRIEVVPNKINNFIGEIENQGGVGKVCGAGSIKGDNAGIVLLFGKRDGLNKVTNKYGFELEELAIDNKGAQLV